MNTVVFYMGLWKHDADKVVQNAFALRQLYPDSDRWKILIISDGFESKNLEKELLGVQACFVLGDRLKPLQFGGLWTHRFLEEALKLEPSVIIKLDGDTQLIGPFESYPEGDLFGCLHSVKIQGQDVSWKFIHGGCMGIRCQAAARMVKSGALKDPKFTQSKYGYRRFGAPFRAADEEHRPNEILTVQDRIVYEVAEGLGLSLVEWPEVDCQPNGNLPSEGTFKAVHVKPACL